jgi:hypothetical protein
MVSVQEAAAAAKRELLAIEGVVGVGTIGNTIVVYVETPEDAAKVPRAYLGFPVEVRVVGRVRPLR